MGGNAFKYPDGTPIVPVPRMTPHQYIRMRDHCATILSRFYSDVHALHPAPEKVDYGDVDFVVSIAHPDATDDRGIVPTATLRDALNAIHVRDPHCLHSERHFAVPWSDANIFPSPSPDTVSTPAAPHAQIDLAVVFPPAHRPWYLLQESHGDLWQIVGKFLRPCGLSATRLGLHFRIQSITDASLERSRSLLFLSRDPAAVCDFLGLDYEAWGKGFDSMAALYEWCVAGRFFSAAAFDKGGEKSSDRTRMSKRGAFREFAVSWLSANRQRVFGGRREWSVDEIAGLAVDYFGKRAEFEERMEAFWAETREKELWSGLAGVIGREGPKLRYAKKALRKWVRFEEGRPVVREEGEADVDKQPVWHKECKLGEDELKEWVAANWEPIKYRERDGECSAKACR